MNISNITSNNSLSTKSPLRTLVNLSSSNNMNNRSQRPERRKTLSYMDLENFLNDTDAVALKPVESSLSKASKSESDMNSVLSSFNQQMSQPISNPVEKSEVDKIREFCSLAFQRKQYSPDASLACSEMIRISKEIHEKTAYQLLPGRTVYPENYAYAPHTLDSKRALIYSMAENLNESERQKKIDSALCEEFTRSKVGKCKDQRSSFTYVDMDINVAISEEDYERRYLLFLESVQQTSKGNKSYQYIKFKEPLQTIKEDSYNEYSTSDSSYSMEGDSSSMNESSSMDNSMNAHNTSRFSTKSSASNRSNRSGACRERRDTLSPASMRGFIETEAFFQEEVTVFDDNLLLFNGQNSQNYQANSESSVAGSWSLTSLGRSRNGAIDTNDSIRSNSMDFNSQKKQKDRRQSITLMNPADMLVDLEMEEFDSSSNGDNQMDSGCSEDAPTVTFGGEFNSVDSALSSSRYLDDRIPSPSSINFDSVHSNSAEDLQYSGDGAATTQRNIYFNKGNSIFLNNDIENVSNHINNSPNEDDFSIEESGSNKRLKSVRSFEPSSLPDLNLQNFQERAYSRMCVRFEALRWKYHWEIVSNHAAIRAQEIFKHLD